jgi:Predicted membrane protein
MSRGLSKEAKGIGVGLTGGILWGLDAILVGVILSRTVFLDNLGAAITIAPFVSTFLHDAFSSLWMIIFLIFTGGIKPLLKSLKTKSALFVALAAIFGGPIGMTGYMLSISYIGASYTAIISAMFPIVGALLSYIFLKEKMSKKGILGLLMAIVATIILGFTSPDSPKNVILGFVFAMLCVFGWGAECVICAYGMKNDVSPESALQIRQLVSAIVYGVIIIPSLKGFNLTAQVMQSDVIIIIIITALAGTASYLCYYSSINSIGATKAMGLNISYSAWAVILGVFFGTPFGVKEFALAAVIVVGSVLTSENPTEFFSLFGFGKKK